MPDLDPLTDPSPLPYGLPDFAKINDDDFGPAFDRAMATHVAQVREIATNPEPATFDNTIAALESSGQELERVRRIFFNLLGPDTNPTRNQIAEKVAIDLSDHENQIAMDPDLFARVSALHAKIDELDLATDQRRLLDQRHRDQIRAGAGLNEAQQAEMRSISSRLAYLSTKFSELILDGANANAVLVESADELAGLSTGAISAARQSAAAAGHESGYLISLELSSSQPILTQLDNPATRQRIFDASIGRCGPDTNEDTSAIVLELIQLRARRAELLGYRDHAEYVIAEQTAPDPAAAAGLLSDLGQASMRAAEVELRELRDLAAQAGTAGATDGSDVIGAADVTYWLEQRRRENSAVPLTNFADYSELSTVLTDGVFAAAEALYGLTFTERPDLRGYHEDVRVFEVRDESGNGVGLYLGDFYARPSKRGGAWMNSLVTQSDLLGQQPVVVNVCNFTKPAPGEPSLLSMDNLRTLFHEFGHTLHGLLSAVRYPSQSGTAVPRDFVEFPSQVNEMWALHPDVLPRYARHHATGEPIPAELAQAARESVSVETAHGSVEYLAAAALDLAWHRLSVAETEAIHDVEAFEAEALAAAGLAHELIPPRYRSAYFNHIFGGGYSAGYYSYIWSEVLDAETEQWFEAEGGLKRDSGRQFAERILSRGDSLDPLAEHKELIGRTAGIDPLLRRRGLAA